MLVELQCQRYRRAKWLFVDVQVGDYRDCDAKSDYRLLMGELDGTVTFTSSQSGTPLDDVRYNYHRRRDEWPFKIGRRKTPHLLRAPTKFQITTAPTSGFVVVLAYRVRAVNRFKFQWMERPRSSLCDGFCSKFLNIARLMPSIRPRKAGIAVYEADSW